VNKAEEIPKPTEAAGLLRREPRDGFRRGAHLRLADLADGGVTRFLSAEAAPVYLTLLYALLLFAAATSWIPCTPSFSTNPARGGKPDRRALFPGRVRVRREPVGGMGLSQTGSGSRAHSGIPRPKPGPFSIHPHLRHSFFSRMAGRPVGSSCPWHASGRA
jgi:hypothetical protein